MVGNHSDSRVSLMKASVLVLAYLASLILVSALIGYVLPDRNPEPNGGFIRTAGVVESTYPSQHNQVRYRYSVAGQSFEETSFAHGPEGDASTLRIGQTITVWYEAVEPSVSCSCVDPNELLQNGNDTPLPFIAAFVLVTAAFLALAGRWLFGDWLAIFAAARNLASGQLETNSQIEPSRPNHRQRDS